MPKRQLPQDDGTSSKLLSPDEARSPHTIDKLTDPSSFFLNIIEDVGRDSCCTKGTQTRLSVLSQSAQRLGMGSVNTLTPGQLAARKVFLWELGDALSQEITMISNDQTAPVDGPEEFEDTEVHDYLAKLKLYKALSEVLKRKQADPPSDTLPSLEKLFQDHPEMGRSDHLVAGTSSAQATSSVLSRLLSLFTDTS